MRIILDKYNSKKIMAVKLWIEDGSRADPNEGKGIHQILSSTISRGCGPYNNNQIAEIVESSGSILNCETFEDGILISLKCISDDAYKLLPLIGYMISKPLLETDQIELEKDLTIKAIKRQKESSYQQAFDGWRQMIYKSGPYGHDPLGSVDDLYKINRENILPLANSLIYRKKNLVITGSFPSDIEEFIKESIAFQEVKTSALEPNKIGYISKCNKSYSNLKSDFCIRYSDTKQIVLLLGKSTISYNNQSDVLLRLISCYLGYGMSSLLFKILREKHGVVYEAGVYHPIRENKTPFVIHASTTIEKAIFTIKLLKECWNTIIESGIPEEELELVKTKFKGQIAHSLQSTSQIAERKAHLLGIGMEINHDSKLLMRLENVNSKDIKNAAERYLLNPSLSVCGRKKIVDNVINEWKS